MAATPSVYRVCSSIHSSALRMARCRIAFEPYFSHNFRTLSMRRKTLRQVKFVRLRRNSSCSPSTTKSSCKLNPAGTGRRGFMACTMERGITMARVQDDIS